MLRLSVTKWLRRAATINPLQLPIELCNDFINQGGCLNRRFNIAVILLILGLTAGVAGVYLAQRPRADITGLEGGVCQNGVYVWGSKPGVSYPDGEYETRLSAGFSIERDINRVGERATYSLATTSSAAVYTKAGWRDGKQLYAPGGYYYVSIVVPIGAKIISYTPQAVDRGSVSVDGRTVIWKAGPQIMDEGDGFPTGLIPGGAGYTVLVEYAAPTLVGHWVEREKQYYVEYGWQPVQANIGSLQGTGTSQKFISVTPKDPFDLTLEATTDPVFIRSERLAPFRLDPDNPSFKVRSNQNATISAEASPGKVQPAGETRLVLSQVPFSVAKEFIVEDAQSGRINLVARGWNRGQCASDQTDGFLNAYQIKLFTDPAKLATGPNEPSRFEIGVAGGELIRDFLAEREWQATILDSTGNVVPGVEYSTDGEHFSSDLGAAVDTTDFRQDLFIRRAEGFGAESPVEPSPSPGFLNISWLRRLVPAARAQTEAESGRFYLQLTLVDQGQSAERSRTYDIFPLTSDKQLDVRVESVMVQGSDRDAAQATITITVWNVATNRPVENQSVDIQVLKKNDNSAVSGIAAATSKDGSFSSLPLAFITNNSGQVVLYTHAKNLTLADAKEPLIVRVTLTGEQIKQDADLPVKYTSIELPGVRACLPNNQECTLN